MNNLFIVGAQRSGSTYLYQALDSHPQVTMARPLQPEPKFFLSAQAVELGKEYYEESYYPDRKLDTRYLGEKSASYIESPDAARRIKSFYPNARILMILRDPVQRAYSNYRFSVMHMLEPLNFADAVGEEAERLQSSTFTTSVTPYAYRQRGHYMNYIESYLQMFDASQLCVLIFEEFVNNRASLQQLFGWLGVNQDFVPSSLKEAFNQTTGRKENHLEVFRDLAFGYQDSIARLEGWLGREIEIWRRNHQALYSATTT